MAPLKMTVLPWLAALPMASAWGALGHTTVAYLAQNLVSHKTAKFAQQLLNDTSPTYLASVATWADSYRNEKGGEFSSVYHYIDALDNPPTSCNVNYERDCAEEGCIVSAIANYSSRAVTPSIGLLEQQKALKWVIHFIGDIHQPLHVENYALGGNQINVTFAGARTNLHAIWDTAIPQKAIGNFSQATAASWAANLTAEIKHGRYRKESKTWAKGLKVKNPIDTAMIWASDANQFVCSTVMPEGPDAVFGKELSGAYYETAIPVVRKQIAKAGVRLAAWLDAVVERAEKGGYGQFEAEKRVVRKETELEPWMREARKARRDFGGDCGCTVEGHGH